MTTATPQASKLFNLPDADVEFISNDNVGFRVYSKHLHSTSHIMDNNGLMVDGPVHLDDPASILEILFQFVHPPTSASSRYPDVGALTKENFFSLAAAGEKYGIYPLTTACAVHMENMMLKKKNPIEILNFCLRHDYPTRMINDAAIQTLAEPISDVAKGLTRTEDLSRWMEFYDSYINAGKEVLSGLGDTDGFPKCLVRSQIGFEYSRNMFNNPASVGIITKSTKSALSNPHPDSCKGLDPYDLCKDSIRRWSLRLPSIVKEKVVVFRPEPRILKGFKFPVIPN